MKWFVIWTNHCKAAWKQLKTHEKGPFQLKTEQTVWDLPIRILPTLPSLAESGIAEAQVTKLL